MTTAVTLPGGIVVRAGGEQDQSKTSRPQWGVYGDACWRGWPGIVVDWVDFGLPTDDASAIAAIREAFARARGGQDVLVGCRGGIGRTGTVLACLAFLAGVPADHAVQWVRDRYRSEAVEARDQANWVVDRFARDPAAHEEAERSRGRLVKVAADRIRNAMRRALDEPEGSPVLEWAVTDVLAVTQRPLRAHPTYGGSRRGYPAEARPALDQWIDRLLKHGIRSVIVLTSNKELAYYGAMTVSEGGLLGLYTGRGLSVVHLPADDPAHDVTAKDAFDAAVDDIAIEVAESLGRISLPAAIHCSAAIDRSPPVAARIAALAEVGALVLSGLQ